MVSHQPTKFVGQKHCGGEDMFLVAEGQDSTCPCPPLLFISKGHGMKAQGISC